MRQGTALSCAREVQVGHQKKLILRKNGDALAQTARKVGELPPGTQEL